MEFETKNTPFTLVIPKHDILRYKSNERCKDICEANYKTLKNKIIEELNKLKSVSYS